MATTSPNLIFSLSGNSNELLYSLSTFIICLVSINILISYNRSRDITTSIFTHTHKYACMYIHLTTYYYHNLLLK